MDDSGTNSTRNGDEPALRALAARLLAPPYPSDALFAEGGQPELSVGRLPENLPSDIPVPDGTTIIGGVSQSLPRGVRTAEVVLDAALPAEDFLEVYRQLLLADGWREDERSPGRRGFVPCGLPRIFHYAASRSSRLRRRLRRRVPGLPELLAHFLLGERGPRMLVTAQDRRNAPTDVRLRLVAGRRGPWTGQDPAWEIIPSLVPPSRARERSGGREIGVLAPPFDARQLGGNPSGAGWENDGAYSYVALETGLDLAELAVHYAAQLEEAGWTRADEGQSGPQAWSTWTLRDEKNRPWTGAFTALRLSERPEEVPDRYLLQINATVTPNR